MESGAQLSSRKQLTTWEQLKSGQTVIYHFPHTLFQEGVLRMTPSNFPIISFIMAFFHFSEGGLTLRFIFRATLLRQHKGKDSLELLTDSACFTNYFSEWSFKTFLCWKSTPFREYVLNENIHL